MKLKLTNLPVLFDELLLAQLNDSQSNLIAAIDAILPQTQCGLCKHPEGCLPYAHAIVTKQELHNKCIPGGQAVTDSISKLLQKQLTNNGDDGTHTATTLSALPSKWSINEHSNRPQEVRAIIREDDCIGCTKCIPACPVDAIVGTGKHIHSIFTDLCTGCELCIAPCPVDCIDLVPIERKIDDSERQKEQDYLRTRYYTHLERVHTQLQDKHNTRPVVSAIESKLSNIGSTTNTPNQISEQQAKHTIQAAKLRTKIKKLEKQLSVRDNDKKRQELLVLQQQIAELTVDAEPC